MALGIGQLYTIADGRTAQDWDGAAYSTELAAIQEQLSASGVQHVALLTAELRYKLDGWDGISPHILVANDRTLRFDSQFIENDPRRDSAPNTITYVVDQSDGQALAFNASGTGIVLVPNAVTEAEIDASMAAWDDFQCNGPNVVKVADPGLDPDWVDNIVFGTPLNLAVPYADIVHAGWLPAAFFNAVIPGGGNSVLAVTFTFAFVENGNLTDNDRNGLPDVAWREIYYNRNFGWGRDGNPFNADIQTVSIHESGHAFGLGHFGRVVFTSKGTFHESPNATMNAGYIGLDRRIYGTDTAAFCSIWANPR